MSNQNMDASNQCQQSQNQESLQNPQISNKDENKNGSNSGEATKNNPKYIKSAQDQGKNGTSVSRGRPPKNPVPAGQAKQFLHLNLFTKNDQTFHSAALVYTAKVFKDNPNLKRLSGFWIYEFALQDKSNFKSLEEVQNKLIQNCSQTYRSFVKNCLSCGPRQVMKEILQLLQKIYELKQQISPNQHNRDKLQQEVRKKIFEIYLIKPTLIGFNKNQYLDKLQLRDAKVMKTAKSEFQEYLKIVVNIALSVLNDQDTNKFYDKVFNEGKNIDATSSYKNQRKPKANTNSNNKTPHSQDPGPKKKQKKS